MFSYLKKSWQGNIPLWQAFYINLILGNIILIVPLLFFIADLKKVDGINPIKVELLYILATLIGFIYIPFSLKCVFRSLRLESAKHNNFPLYMVGLVSFVSLIFMLVYLYYYGTIFLWGILLVSLVIQ